MALINAKNIYYFPFFSFLCFCFSSRQYRQLVECSEKKFIASNQGVRNRNFFFFRIKHFSHGTLKNEIAIITITITKFT